MLGQVQQRAFDHPAVGDVLAALGIESDYASLDEAQRLKLLGKLIEAPPPLADRSALAEMTREVLDVFDEEPLPPDSPLWAAPNFVITPHVSADDGDSYVPITLELFFDNLQRYLVGEPLMNVVRPELGY